MSPPPRTPYPWMDPVFDDEPDDEWCGHCERPVDEACPVCGNDERRNVMDLLRHSLVRRECAKCGAPVGGTHFDHCGVDRAAPIVEVEYVRADAYEGAVAALEQIATEGTTTDREIAARGLGFEDWEHFDRRDLGGQ